MAGIDWRFPALLIIAMLLNAVLTWLQMRRYNSELNAALSSVHDDSLMLCSGRGRSWRGGAIIIMIVKTCTNQIVSAKAMTGFTVFAWFRPMPELLGSVDDAADRVAKKSAKAAVTMALSQLRSATQRAQSCENGSRTYVRRPQTKRLQHQQPLTTTH